MKSLIAALSLVFPAAIVSASPLTPGTVFKTEKSGSLVIVDKNGRTEEYLMRRGTKILRDGKTAVSEHALIGDAVIRGVYDPKTKILKLLELKSGTLAAPPALPDKNVKGDVALADAIHGSLSVRVGNGKLHDFSVTEATKVLLVSEDKLEKEVLFEIVAVGDNVEVLSADGRLADVVRVRSGAR